MEFQDGEEPRVYRQYPAPGAFLKDWPQDRPVFGAEQEDDEAARAPDWSLSVSRSRQEAENSGLADLATTPRIALRAAEAARAGCAVDGWAGKWRQVGANGADVPNNAFAPFDCRAWLQQRGHPTPGAAGSSGAGP